MYQNTSPTYKSINSFEYSHKSKNITYKSSAGKKFRLWLEQKFNIIGHFSKHSLKLIPPYDLSLSS
jgi:hypothetical protein